MKITTGDKTYALSVVEALETLGLDYILTKQNMAAEQAREILEHNGFMVVGSLAQKSVSVWAIEWENDNSS